MVSFSLCVFLAICIWPAWRYFEVVCFYSINFVMPKTRIPMRIDKDIFFDLWTYTCSINFIPLFQTIFITITLSELVYLTIYMFCQLDINVQSCFSWSYRIGKVTDSNHILIHLSHVIYISAHAMWVCFFLRRLSVWCQKGLYSDSTQYNNTAIWPPPTVSASTNAYVLCCTTLLYILHMCVYVLHVLTLTFIVDASGG